MNMPGIPICTPPTEFAAFTPAELLERLVREEDRASVALIDACVERGEAMVDALGRTIDDARTWIDDRAGGWWLPLHAALILGRIPTEPAGLLLVRLMRNMDEHGDTDLQDWVAGDWPALFANKPPAASDAARELARDDARSWYIRLEALSVVLDAGMRGGAAVLEQAIDWVAALAVRESGEWLFRVFTGCALLDFPRPRHRALLVAMSDDEARDWKARGDLGPVFTREDVEHAFSINKDDPAWRHRPDPWEFYTPDAIAERQQRWQKEEEDDAFPDPDWDVPVPYVRDAPKVGRNEPCPCGSGRKYKRCCLAKDEAAARAALARS